MSSLYESIGRLVAWAIWTRYRREIRIALGVGVATVLAAGYLAATREPPEG